MSGTSLDGIDIIYADFTFNTSWKFKIHKAQTVEYSKQWKTELSQLVNKSIEELRKIDSDYSEYLATKINDFIQKNNITEINFISSHGHTALHQPEKGLTYQIGNLQVLADRLKEKVICDFRVQDVALGGQGAPLVPIGDRLLFKEYDYCLNLGGFANISYEYENERIAFDICPVNIVLNHYVSRINLEYDDKGAIASSGKICEKLLRQLNDIKFYKTKPPKSLGLEWVDYQIFQLIDEFELDTKTILRTFVEHIAIQISNVINSEKANVLVTGGGAYNEFLINRIKKLSDAKISIPEKKIIEFKEAIIFGLLGVLKDKNEINCLKSVTGAKKSHSSGKVLIPNPEN